MEVNIRLRMHGNDIRTGIGIILQIRSCRINHQVDIERLFGGVPDRLDDRRTEGQVPHKVAVHDINVDVVRAGFIDGTDFVSQSREIRRQD